MFGSRFSPRRYEVNILLFILSFNAVILLTGNKKGMKRAELYGDVNI